MLIKKSGYDYTLLWLHEWESPTFYPLMNFSLCAKALISTTIENRFSCPKKVAFFKPAILTALWRASLELNHVSVSCFLFPCNFTRCLHSNNNQYRVIFRLLLLNQLLVFYQKMTIGRSILKAVFLVFLEERLFYSFHLHEMTVSSWITIYYISLDEITTLC